LPRRDCDTNTVTVVKESVSSTDQRQEARVSEAVVRRREPADAELLTLEELTARVGLSVRTVRFYTSRGLVPPPLRQGRSGYYTPDHVARLELVQELQAHGFTLAAIEGYLQGIPDDASPADIALRRTMLAPWQSDRPVTMTRGEIEARADRPLSDHELALLAALGIAVHDGDHDAYRVAVSQLSLGLQLIDLGFPLEAARAAGEVYREHGRQIAHEVYEVFRRKAWPAYRDSGASPETVQAVIERLKPLSIASLVAAYEQGMVETQRRNISQRSGG
jgi:DNA-binding transcriptional MerR regulator